MKKFIVFALVLCIAPFISAQDVLLDTMGKELNRNFKVLKKQTPPVYFLSYYVIEDTSFRATATLGDLLSENSNFSRTLNVDARAGSRKLDNSHESKKEDNLSLNNYYVPVENDTAAIKNVLWRATEEEAKKAQDQFLKIQTDTGIRATGSDESDDFSAPQKARAYYGPQKPAQINQTQVKELIKRLSSLTKTDPEILDAWISFSSSTKNKYIVTSEGSKIVEGQTLVRLSFSLYARNADGMELEAGKSYDGLEMSDLPAEEDIAKDIQENMRTLKTLINAPALEPFSGPVILRNQAAGVFFHEILGHRIEGHRQKSESFGQTFTKQVGKEIVSPILSIYDDPTLTHYNGVPLRGAYKYDDDGVKSEKVTIVENGMLKNFLMGRSPIKDFLMSNGHGRKSLGKRSVSRMGNTIAKVKDPVSFEELKKMLKAEIKKQGKPYGLIIENISGGFTMIDRDAPQSFKVHPLLIYRVYPDDRKDDIVRGLDIVGTPLASFSKIAAGADDVKVFNGNCGAESGWVPVSAVSPSILISELEMEKSEKSSKSLPVMPPPSAQQPAAKGGK